MKSTRRFAKTTSLLAGGLLLTLAATGCRVDPGPTAAAADDALESCSNVPAPHQFDVIGTTKDSGPPQSANESLLPQGTPDFGYLCVYELQGSQWSITERTLTPEELKHLAEYSDAKNMSLETAYVVCDVYQDKSVVSQFHLSYGNRAVVLSHAKGCLSPIERAWVGVPSIVNLTVAGVLDEMAGV